MRVLDPLPGGAVIDVGERERILRACLRGELSQKEAVSRLRIHRSTLARWLQRVRRSDAHVEGFRHGLTGRPSNHRLPESLRQQVCERFERYYLPRQMNAAELYWFEGALLRGQVSLSTVRRWLSIAGLVSATDRGARERLWIPGERVSVVEIPMERLGGSAQGWLTLCMDLSTREICAHAWSRAPSLVSVAQTVRHTLLLRGLPLSLQVSSSRGDALRPVLLKVEELGVECVESSAMAPAWSVASAFLARHARLHPLDVRIAAWNDLHPKALPPRASAWVQVDQAEINAALSHFY